MADLYDLGDKPPLGDVPSRMHAYVVRQNRFGPPREAWKREVIPTPTIGPDEVLIYVMASGINYNNVWAALGQPLGVIAERQRLGEPEDFHAGGSDCSGIVWATGKDVKNVKVGDEVIIHSGWWRPDDPWVLSGKDPMLAESTRIWGYQTNYGSYCQFARAQGHQCIPSRSGSPGKRRAASSSAPPPRTGCSWAGRPTRWSGGTWCWCGAPRAGSAAWPSRSRARRAAARWPW